MLLPSQEPSPLYSLLRFGYVTSQLRHSLVVHPLLTKILDPPLWLCCVLFFCRFPGLAFVFASACTSAASANGQIITISFFYSYLDNWKRLKIRFWKSYPLLRGTSLKMRLPSTCCPRPRCWRTKYRRSRLVFTLVPLLLNVPFGCLWLD